MNELKDVKCAKCGRVIGQRRGGMFYQFGFQTQFTKSQKIFCPFIGCRFGQLFKVNKDGNHKYLLTNIYT
jgi:hypothetical protein